MKVSFDKGPGRKRSKQRKRKRKGRGGGNDCDNIVINDCDKDYHQGTEERKLTLLGIAREEQ